MSIKGRLALLSGGLLLAFLVVLQTLRQMERTRTGEWQDQSLRAGQAAVRHWISLTGQPLQRFVQDCSQWRELAGYLATRDPAWAQANLKPNLAHYEIHALWLLDAKGALIYSARSDTGPSLPAPGDPVSLGRPAGVTTHRHFFTDSRDGLLEVWGEPIVPADGAGAAAPGWILVSRLWSDRFLVHLGSLVEANLQLLPAGGSPARDSSPAPLLLPLANLEQKPLRQLQVRFALPDHAGPLATSPLASRLFVVFGLLVIGCIWLCLQRWVLRPLQLIDASLTQGSTAPIEPLKREKGELGRVARFVEASFAQKIALQNEIAERKRTEAALRESEEAVRTSLGVRTRLARDLHDGVIQSIYAAGLGLESALAQLEPDPSGARTRLQLCRQGLNDAIRQVRGFISKLEPEQMPRQGFAQELAGLARTMETLWPVRIVLQVEEQAARRLSARQEVHALQIVRECIGNALRHGGAKEVTIILLQSSGRGILTIRDDGRGFDPEKSAGRGSGLLNLATRAREMEGALRLDSQPGHGAVVEVTFSLTNPAP